jgi:ribonuclease P protein component
MCASPLLHMRVGFVVPRHGHSAVDRNRLKRQLRELTRKHLLRDAPTLDIVLHANRGAFKQHFDDLTTEMMRVVQMLSEYPS